MLSEQEAEEASMLSEQEAEEPETEEPSLSSQKLLHTSERDSGREERD